MELPQPAARRSAPAHARPEASPPHAGRLPALLCLAALLLTAALTAATEPLWFDELATYYISGAPEAEQIFQALRGAADAQPPLVFLVTRALRAVFGSGELAVRLQAVLSFGLFAWLLYRLVETRAGAPYGVTAMLFAASTMGFEYAYEARPYALVMALCALSLWLWSRYAEAPAGRTGLLWGLGGAVALLVSAHYYAVLLIVPLGAGELARSVRNRSADWRVWLALTAPCGVLAFYLPFIQAVRSAYQQNFFSPATGIDAWGFYMVLLAPALAPMLAALAAAAVVAKLRDPAPPGDDPARRGSMFPPHELAAALAFALIPLAYVALAMAATGAFVYRYALGALVGVTLVAVDVLHNQLGARHKAVWAAAAALAICFLGTSLAPAVGAALDGGKLGELERDLAAMAQAAREPGPVAVSAPSGFLQYAHYAPPELRARLEYWSDPEEALARRETDSAERALANLAPWAGLRVETYRMVDDDLPFYLAEVRRDKYDWLTAALEERFGQGENLYETRTRRLVRMNAR